MAQNLLVAGPLKRHGSCSCLAKSDSVSLAAPSQQDLVAVVKHFEMIAGYGIPTETPTELETRGFVRDTQQSGIAR